MHIISKNRPHLMTTKTIKTIVFAALFAAMILPFSGMQSVHAVHESEEEHGADETPVEVIPQGENGMEVIADGESEMEVIQNQTHNTHSPVEVIPDGESEMEVILQGSDEPEFEIIPIEPEL